jgi:hypothetical protein
MCHIIVCGAERGLAVLCWPNRMAVSHPSVPIAAAAAAGPKGGRRIAPAGQKDMDLIAGRVQCSLPSFGL